jgi:coenzyme F420-reducing hydrogenase delta subunit
VIERLLRGGAPGVIVCACPPRDCVNREGPTWLDARLYHDREAELQSRVDRRRVAIATLAPGDLSGTCGAFVDFARRVSSLDRPAFSNDEDPNLVCEPVPFEEAT